jgi:hypothetical protein
MNRIFFLVMIVMTFGCNSHTGQTVRPEKNQAANSFYTIDFPALLENKKELAISEISDSIVYIPLESIGESALGTIHDAKLTKDYIFIHSYGTPLLAQFDIKGKFLRYIGKIGKGPQEYDLIRHFSVDEEAGLIFIQPNWLRVIQVYSFTGEFVKTIKINRDEREIVWSRDSLFICYSEPSIGNEEFVFKETNSHGEILQAVKNYNKWKDPPPFGRMMSYPGQYFFYQFDNHLHFKGMYNDTVYTYSVTNKIIPKYSINLGKFRLPQEMIYERGLVTRIAPKYLWVTVKESKSFVFIYYSAYDTDDSQGSGHGLPDAGFIVYNKEEKVGTTLKSSSGKMFLFNNLGDWGFINDFDGGPELIPSFVNDSLAFRFISSIAMKNYLSSDKFLNSTPKDQVKKSMLLRQMSGLKETDNDILMIAKLK